MWARGIGVLDGCFILEVLERHGASLRISAVRWVRQPSGISVPLVGRAEATPRGAGGWFLEWLDA